MVDLGRGDPTTLAIVLNFDPNAPESVKTEYLKMSLVLSAAQIAIFSLLAFDGSKIAALTDFKLEVAKLVCILMFHWIVKNDCE